jgi:hypothetical protein
VNHSLVNIFQTARFFADTFDLVYLYVSPLQESGRLPVAEIAECINAF